jgi:hypothetical protein
MPHHRRADETHTACQKNDHEAPHPFRLFEYISTQTALYVSSMTVR